MKKKNLKPNKKEFKLFWIILINKLWMINFKYNNKFNNHLSKIKKKTKKKNYHKKKKKKIFIKLDVKK
jgi:hypothetical protein